MSKSFWRISYVVDCSMHDFKLVPLSPLSQEWVTDKDMIDERELCLEVPLIVSRVS